MESLKRKRTQLRREFTMQADEVEQSEKEQRYDEFGDLFGLLSDTAEKLFDTENALRDVWCADEHFDEELFQADQDKAILYHNNRDGMKSVNKSGGSYVYLMESTAPVQKAEKECDVLHISNKLNTGLKYAIALPRKQKNDTCNNSILDLDPQEKSDLSEDFSGTESNYTPPPYDVVSNAYILFVFVLVLSPTSSEDEHSMDCREPADPVDDLSFLSDHRKYSPPNILDKRIQDSSINFLLQNNIEDDLSYVSNSPCQEIMPIPKNLIEPGSENLIYAIPSEDSNTVLSVPENEIDVLPSIPENEIRTVSSVHNVTIDSYCGNKSNTTQTQKENLKPKKVIRDRDFCFFCENLVLNFARHLLRQHMYEPEVQRIVSYPKNSIKRKSKITELRKKGNYIQNAVNVTKPMRKQNIQNIYLALIV
ncbi:hypothetical protein ACJJTC_019396 [Scirpophaga incertulas]